MGLVIKVSFPKSQTVTCGGMNDWRRSIEQSATLNTVMPLSDQS